jgi:plastocyanin
VRVARDVGAALSTVVGPVLALVVLVAWGFHDADVDERRRLIAATAAPLTFEVSAGRFSPAGASEEFAAYYPDRLRAHPGDTIRFTNPTEEDPHSVTYGLAADRSNQPRYGTGAGATAVTDGPCVSPTAPLLRTTVECDGTTDLGAFPPFAGQPYYNSGIVPPGGGTFELVLDDRLPTGTYLFRCVVHAAQVLEVAVVEPSAPTQRPSTLADAAERLAADDVATMARLGRSAPPVRPREVAAGIATERASRNVFAPSTVEIAAGDEVTWRNAGSVPHVMVFGEGAAGLPAPEAAVRPPTSPSGSTLPAGGDLFTTGPIGAPPYPATSFSLRFDAPGTYHYTCVFHPGMSGTVVVDGPALAT